MNYSSAERESSIRDLVRDIAGVDVGKDFKTNFATRLVFQKTMYLLQKSGVIREKHPFNYYVHGPYSPGWAKIGYEVANGRVHKVTIVGVDNNVRELINRKPNDGSWLVALSTLHYYVTTLRLSKERAKEKALEDGKFALLKHFDDAWKSLDSLKFFGES